MDKTFQNEYAPTEVSHPGETLGGTLEALGMSQKELAARMGRPLKTINEIIHGKTWITPETALQLETVLRVPANFWLKRQSQYDEFLARKEQSEELAKHVSWLKNFPLKEMGAQFGFSLQKDSIEQVRQVLMFFGVASSAQWEEYWNAVTVNYRKSDAFASHAGAMAAWLRKGELDAQQIECEEFDAQKLKDVLEEIRSLTIRPPEIFQPGMKELCAAVGVAHVLTPELPKTRVCGATRWLNSKKALLQQSSRYKWNDQFWFTFFHEAGHLILHGRQDLIVEFPGGVRTKTEEEANRFAADCLIDPDDFAEFVEEQAFSEKSVKLFAKARGIAPAIVVGRLQHDKLIRFNQLNGLKEKFFWSFN